jgi:transposase InsO family protein
MGPVGLKPGKVIRPTPGKGNGRDNAPMENFFGRLKEEAIPA